MVCVGVWVVVMVVYVSDGGGVCSGVGGVTVVVVMGVEREIVFFFF